MSMIFPVTLGTRAMHEDLPEEDDDKYWVRITASNGKLDTHNSIMDPETTLKNFEEDAKSDQGVALKDHHGYRSFGYGRSTDAMLSRENELYIDFFILKEMQYSDNSLHFSSSKSLIRAIEQGLVNQASVGFYGAREICNLCQMPVRRYYWYDSDYYEGPGEKSKGRSPDWYPEGTKEYCTHKMGKVYENKNGKKQTATYTVYDARLKEVSLVEFGSNRYTSISKRFFPGADFPVSQEEVIGMRSFIEELLMTDKEWIIKLRDALNIPDVRSTDEPDAVVEKMETEVTSLRQQIEEQKDEIADLQTDAADGKAYRVARIDEAIKQGIRAYGDDFDEDYHRDYYGAMPLETLENHIAQNKKKGDKALPAGRSTTDEHEPPPEKEGSLRQRQRRKYRRR